MRRSTIWGTVLLVKVLLGYSEIGKNQGDTINFILQREFSGNLIGCWPILKVLIGQEGLFLIIFWYGLDTVVYTVLKSERQESSIGIFMKDVISEKLMTLQIFVQVPISALVLDHIFSLVLRWENFRHLRTRPRWEKATNASRCYVPFWHLLMLVLDTLHNKNTQMSKVATDLKSSRFYDFKISPPTVFVSLVIRFHVT